MFMKHYLGMADTKSRFLMDQLGFLKDIIRAYLIRFPFQNLTSFGQYRPLDRKPPGLKEMLEANFRGGGGLCGHNNVFLRFQMESMGFQVQQLQGSFNRTPVPRSHNLAIVRINAEVSKEAVKLAKTYLIDVGCGVPLHEPICLEELPVMGRGGGFDYRYERIDENTVQRVNICGDPIIGRKDASFVSPQDYKIFLNPVDFSESKEPIRGVYENPHSVFLHQGIYCFRYLDIGPDDFSIVCIRGTDIIFITRETRRVESYGSYKELEPQIYKYFPMIDPREIRETVKNFSIPLKEALRLANEEKERERERENAKTAAVSSASS